MINGSARLGRRRPRPARPPDGPVGRFFDRFFIGPVLVFVGLLLLVVLFWAGRAISVSPRSRDPWMLVVTLLALEAYAGIAFGFVYVGAQRVAGESRVTRWLARQTRTGIVLGVLGATTTVVVAWLVLLF